MDEYTDQAVGVMGKNEAGKVAMLQVTLRPRVRFSGSVWPDEAAHVKLHEAAHEECFIANSVKTEVICAPTAEQA